MTVEGKEFVTNFRNARMNPFVESSPASLITRGDIQKARQADYKNDAAYDRAEERYINRLVEETAPLRKEIREASDGRIIVDDSIYDKTSLKRLLGTVKEMRKVSNGALIPGYAIVTDGNSKNMTDSENLGEAQYSEANSLRFAPSFQFQLLPRQTFGTKNVPYRVRLKDANDYQWNDFLAREANNSGWSIESFNDGDVESATHTHELAHTAYYDALKKTSNPTFTGYKSKAAVDDFRRNHSSLQEIFDIAAKNTGYNSVQDAAATISKYALQDAKDDAQKGGLDKSKNWSPNYQRLSELFAEAYADVLHNRNNANKYSKELIRLYTEYVNDYNKAFNGKIVLNQDLNSPDFGRSNFFNNLRMAR